MKVFKTTSQIMENKWPLDRHFEHKELPRKYEWLKEEAITISDVDVWEQIYSQSGNIGIYAAWSPYQEIYLITHNQFLEESFGLEVFQGNSASDQVHARAKEFNITLKQSAVWI